MKPESPAASAGPPRSALSVPAIPPVDPGAATAARSRQSSLTKPPGSLGRLEELSIQLAAITGRVRPLLERKAVIIMAGDHGVTAEGVSAYPPEVTSQMVMNFLSRGAAASVLARQVAARVVVVDVGVAAELSEESGLTVRKVAAGTRNMKLGPAMTAAQTEEAIAAGMDVVEREIASGLDIACTGEMGIGNTTAASAIVAALTGMSVADVTGRGTGLDDEAMRRKTAVIEAALRVNRPDSRDGFDVLMKLGGFEIAALVGVVLRAASKKVPVVLDGFISGVAALVAARLVPEVTHYLIAGHRSVEPGHAEVLRALDLRPLLDLELRLGEGTGALLALPIVEAAARVLNEMTTFEEAGVSGPSEPSSGNSESVERK